MRGFDGFKSGIVIAEQAAVRSANPNCAFMIFEQGGRNCVGAGRPKFAQVLHVAAFFDFEQPKARAKPNAACFSCHRYIALSPRTSLSVNWSVGEGGAAGGEGHAQPRRRSFEAMAGLKSSIANSAEMAGFGKPDAALIVAGQRANIRPCGKAIARGE